MSREDISGVASRWPFDLDQSLATALPATNATADRSRIYLGGAQRDQMAALYRIAANLRAVLAAHVSSSSWMGLFFGSRIMSSATVWCVSQPRRRISR
jgi:hypothetical protein